MPVWHALCINTKPVSLVVNNRVMVLGTGRDDRSLFLLYIFRCRLIFVRLIIHG